MAQATARRSTLAVPASSQRMLEKAKGLATDAAFLDLEDSVSPLAKDQARSNAIGALVDGGFGQETLSVRVNAVTTQWHQEDLTAVVRGAPGRFDAFVLPKVQGAADILAVAARLDVLEQQAGLPVGSIGIEAQIEDARGLVNVDQIAAASPRLQSLIFGPADFMASINMRSLVVGLQPPGYPEGDAYHYVLMRILVAARAFGIQAIDGPYLGIKDLDGLRTTARRSAALGFDGKWVLHPDQIDIVNDVFSPSQADFDHAQRILEAYELSTSAQGGARGAVMLGDEMIDEASRKMALVISAAGRAAGLSRSTAGGGE